MHLHAVILAGGKGERFWPLSRRDRPKQFLPLLGERTLLQETADRLDGWVPPENRWVVAAAGLMPEIRKELPGLDPARCIAEPVARNTAAAIGAAAAVIAASDPDALTLVLPSDHWIPDSGPFREDVERACVAAGSHDGLFLFGIPPAYPETGYGYIREGTELPGFPGVHEVERFHEKPDMKQALDYARRPEMVWNSGIFLWRVGTVLGEIERWIPGMRARLAELREALAHEGGRIGPESGKALDRFFLDAPSEPIDSAVLEKADRTFVTRARFRWSDVGNWKSWGDRLEADAQGIRGQGIVLVHDAKDCVLYSAPGGMLALLGVRDLIVVRLPDVTMVCSRERSQDVKNLVKEMQDRGDLDQFL